MRRASALRDKTPGDGALRSVPAHIDVFSDDRLVSGTMAYRMEWAEPFSESESERINDETGRGQEKKVLVVYSITSR